MGQTVVEKKSKNKIKVPKLYKVMLLNDDYTTMEFVIEVLKNIFGKEEAEAFRIMQEVHKNGKGTAGVYSYDIAQSKVVRVEALAKQNSFPLKAVLEEE